MEEREQEDEHDRTHDIIPAKGGSGKDIGKEVVLVGCVWQGQIRCRLSPSQFKGIRKAEQHLEGNRHEES